jgi:PilZ domain
MKMGRQSEIDDREIPDLRKSSRKKVLTAARTCWPNGYSSECVVHDISETGARLELYGPVPNIFDLVMDDEGSRRTCVVVWRHKLKIGVRFNNVSSIAASREKSRLARCTHICKIVAEHVTLICREILLEMAETLTKVARLRRNNDR